MPFKQLSLRKEDAVLKPDDPTEPIIPHYWVRAQPDKDHGGGDAQNPCSRLHFSADGESAQSYTPVWDTNAEGCVMQVYTGDKPAQADRSVVSIGSDGALGSVSGSVHVKLTGCDGLEFGQQGSKHEQIYFVSAPTKPGTMQLSFDPSGVLNNYDLFLDVTTDYVGPPEPIHPIFWMAAIHVDLGTEFEEVTRVHFNADGISAQCYNGDTAGYVIIVYNGIDTPDTGLPPDTLKVDGLGPEIADDIFLYTKTGCDGMEWTLYNPAMSKGRWWFIKPPTTPGTMVASFSAGKKHHEVEVEVTTDYVLEGPPTIGELAFVVGAHGTWDDEHKDSLSFYPGQDSVGVRCVRDNMKQTSDGATFKFSRSTNVFTSARDDYCFVRAQNTATVGEDGYYRCTVELAGAADSPKPIVIPVHIVCEPGSQPAIGACKLHYTGTHQVGVEEECYAVYTPNELNIADGINRGVEMNFQEWTAHGWEDRPFERIAPGKNPKIKYATENNGSTYRVICNTTIDCSPDSPVEVADVWKATAPPPPVTIAT